MIRSVGLLLRLAGSDAPEHDQPCGQRSRRSLAELAFKSVGRRSEAAVVAGRCGAKHTCGAMTLVGRGAFYLNQCELSRLDGDKDGMLCETLCR